MNKIQNYIALGQEIYVGLEDSKKNWKLCVRSNGVVINEANMPADYQNLRNYFNNKFPKCKIHVMYEAGFRGFSLYDKIVADGWKCVIIPPHLVTEEKCNRQKNDKTDCRRLAKNLENNDYKKCFVPDEQLRIDRQFSRMYAQIRKDITRTCNRIRRALEFHGLDNNFKSGRWYESDYKNLLQKLNSLKIPSLLLIAFEKYMHELVFLWDMRKDVYNTLKELAKSERYKHSVDLLKSAPGIGILTAIRLVLEWGNLVRFSRKESFANFLGLIPSEQSSGETEHKGHITKQGNRQVRAMLIESSWTAIKYDPVLYDKFNRVIKNCGSKKMAIVAVARKLALRLRTLLLNDQFYKIGLVA